MNNNKPSSQNLTVSELSGLEERLADAARLGLALDDADIALIQNIIASFYHLQQQLQEKNITLDKLRRMCGLTPSSERSSTHGKANSHGSDDACDAEHDVDQPQPADEQSETSHNTGDSNKGESAEQTKKASDDSTAANDPNESDAPKENPKLAATSQKKSGKKPYGASTPWSPAIEHLHKLGFNSGYHAPYAALMVAFTLTKSPLYLFVYVRTSPLLWKSIS